MSHCLKGFIHVSWCRSSSTNSITTIFTQTLNYRKCCVIVFVPPMVLLNLGKLLEFLNLKYGDFFGGGLGGGVLLLNHHFGMTWAEVARIRPNWIWMFLKCPPRFSKRLLLYSIYTFSIAFYYIIYICTYMYMIVIFSSATPICVVHGGYGSDVIQWVPNRSWSTMAQMVRAHLWEITGNLPPEQCNSEMWQLYVIVST